MPRRTTSGRAAALALALSAGCVGVQDDPSSVHDLRVLGASLEPPELMASQCPNLTNLDPAALLAQLSDVAEYANPVTFKALVADPAGQGRTFSWSIRACGNPSDVTCTNAWESVELARGFGSATGLPPQVNGVTPVDTEVSIQLTPGLTFLDGGFYVPDAGVVPYPLLFQVLQDDPYKGIDGLWMPLVFHVVADPPPGGDAGVEEIYAQKLMVFSCPFFPDMKPNQTPHLRGFQLDGAEWAEDAIPSRTGVGPFHVTADDVSDLQEAYGVVDFNLQEVHLTEAWIIDYYATLGTFSPSETGGVDFGGNTDPHSTGWSPGAGTHDEIVTFWFTVRDGRGGESWTKRLLHYLPPP
jgi:hypothetical protein